MVGANAHVIIQNMQRDSTGMTALAVAVSLILLCGIAVGMWIWKRVFSR